MDALDVQVQVVLSEASRVALLAGEGFLFFVDLGHVPVELVLLPELFDTLAAHELLQFVVHSLDVTIQAVFGRKLLIAIALLATKFIFFFVNIFDVTA